MFHAERKLNSAVGSVEQRFISNGSSLCTALIRTHPSSASRWSAFLSIPDQRSEICGFSFHFTFSHPLFSHRNDHAERMWTYSKKTSVVWDVRAESFIGSVWFENLCSALHLDRCNSLDELYSNTLSHQLSQGWDAMSPASQIPVSCRRPVVKLAFYPVC